MKKKRLNFCIEFLISRLKYFRLKAEQALQAITLKIDNEIGSRMKEIEQMENELKAKQQNFKKWKESFWVNQQEMFVCKQIAIVLMNFDLNFIFSYEKLMHEKQDEERLERDARLEEIRREHAAKVIQKAWRGLKKKHRKAKKGKMQKKSANKRL